MLRELVLLPDEALVDRCSGQLLEVEGYVPPECLVYLVRNKHGANARTTEKLFKTLLERVYRRLPERTQTERRGLALTGSNIADEVFGNFLTMLAADSSLYDVRLDIYEVVFNKSLQTLYLDGEKKVWRRDSRNLPYAIDEESGELADKLQEQIGYAEPFGMEQLERAEFHGLIGPSMDQLPEVQREIVRMFTEGKPIHSKDPSVDTITKATGKCEKTVHTYLKQALDTLNTALNGDHK